MDLSEISNECLLVIFSSEFLIGVFSGMIVMGLAMFVSVLSHGKV